ncbi:internal virion protein [Xanthomonas phage vB_Xar_IVIA-DoCa9]|uniref:Internal virion protein n=1 Tax=Xanthomonas phage vB_Xar_IVIA-DoCa9 TaxID=2975536 RepID=A0A9X9NZ20_9CAUD|nr:internal virion protein [Xanthomonas phage vB_Xar_IVIA-DoCa9]
MALDLSGLTQDQQIAAAAAYAGVPESVVRGQWRVESGNGRAQKDAQGIITSEAGARGDFQVMPQTQAVIEARTGKKYDVRNFQDNLEMYAHIMRENMQLAKGDVTTALRIYHGGTNRANWGPKNAAYAPAVLGGDAAPAVAPQGAASQGSISAAWAGAGSMTTQTWSGASIPAAWRGDDIEGGGGSLARATKEYIGKVREGLGELAMGQNVMAGGTAEQGVAAAQAVRGSDEVVPWWVRQEVSAIDTQSNERNTSAAIAATQSDRDEVAFRDSLSFLDKWGAAFDSGIGAALTNQLSRDREVTPEGWTYDPKQWEKSYYTADELEDIRDAAYSPDELSYVTDRIYMRRHSMRIKENQTGWGSFGYDLVAGLTDPGNWATGGLASGGARALGVGSAALFAEGRVAAGIASSVAENAAASVITDAALAGMGENRTVADFMTDAAFSAGIGTAMNLRGIRSAAAVRDKATIDLASGNAAMYGEQWNADLRARAVAEVGEGNPVALNAKVHSLARAEVMDWIRAGMADVPDDFRLFARPDVAQEAPAASNATGALARDVENVDPSTGNYADNVGGRVEWNAPADPLLTRAWKASGIKGTPDDILRYLESSKNVPEDFRAIANTLKRSGRLNGVRIAPDAELAQWFPNQPNVAGGYNPSLNAMAMRSSAHNAEVVLHEMLHAATFRSLRQDANFKAQMDELLTHVNANLSEADRNLMTQAMQGRVDQERMGFLANSDELVSYGLTNRDVQAVLRNISAPPGATQQTAWEWLKDKIARVLGLTGQESALERLMNVVGENLGEEIRSPQASSQQTRSMLVNSIFKNNRERKAFMQRTGLDKQISDSVTRIQVAEVIGRAERFSGKYAIDAEKLSTIMQKFGLEATSTTLMSSQSPVARMIAVTLLENPEGAAGRHSTAAMDRRGRFESFMGSRPRQWEAAYRLWRADVRKAGAVKDFATGWKMRSEFEYEVKLYRETMYMGREIADAHESIKQMAKALDEGYNRMAAEQRAVGTVGSARLPDGDVAGYESRTWLGGKIAAAGRVRRESIRQALRDQFDVMGELYGDKFLDDLSIKYLERIEERAAGMNRAPDNLFSDNQSDTLRDTLRALSLNEEEIQKVMGRYSRGGAKHTKSRIDLDVTRKYKDAEGEFRLMDYLDNRVMDNYRKYAGRVAGDIALAKHGIMGDAGISVLRKAMQVTGANDVELRAFDQVMSEFTGRVIGTGDPTVLANARLLTSAIQLGGAGINQAAEYSNGLPAVGAAGVAEAIRIAPRMRAEIGKLLRGEDPENSILGGFEFISGRGFGLAGYDLHMFNSLDTQASLYGSERAGFLTALAQRTANANRILSGQRAVLAVQQRGFAEVLIAKGVKFLRDGKAADTALKDMGLDDTLLARLRQTQDQVVRWGADGKLEAVDPRGLENLHDRQAWLAFYNAIDRGTNQILQDTFIGETGKWAHNGWLKMLFQHRTFSLVAQQKQLGRYMGLYGAWGTAGIIASAMAVVAPLQALRVASRAVLLPEEQREQAIEDALSPLAMGRSTMNYISATAFLGDVLEVGTGVAGGWYEHATDTGSPDWVRQLAGGQLGNRKEIVGGSFAPALGVINDFAQGVSGRPENLADVLPGGRLPYVIPLLKGAAAHLEE